MNEGNPSLVRRNGIFAQLWAVRTFIDPRVTIEAGIGPYVIVDAHGESVAEGGRERLAGIISLGTSYLLAPRWHLRATWNRVLADRPFDSDVFLVGGAYLF